MKSQQQHLEDLNEIRSLMERSSRFISLSGLSGVFAGIFALIGAALVYQYLEVSPFAGQDSYHIAQSGAEKWGLDALTFFLLTAGGVLFLAISTGIFLTVRKARKKGQKIWDKLSQRLVVSALIPLATGGIFCLSLLKYGLFGFVAPATLIFYGLALVNASKYTLHDIFYLGLIEIGLGLLALHFIGYGLDFWAIGFGIMHIIYGSWMYFKYERA
ncbi:MAG: hypothetical protein AB8G15_04650 [Saprospiraceae bacterium]